MKRKTIRFADRIRLIIARRRFNRMIKVIGYDNVIYSDTDSLKFAKDKRMVLRKNRKEIQ